MNDILYPPEEVEIVNKVTKVKEIVELIEDALRYFNILTESQA